MGRACGRDTGCVSLGYFPLPGLRRLPRLVVHDAKLGNLGEDPLLGRVDPRDPLAGVRVLHKALAVPHQSADIEFVVEQPRAALGVAAHHRVAPEPALCAGDAFVVQPPRDGARAGASGKLSEDAPDDLERAPPRVLQKRLDAGPENHAVSQDGGVPVRTDDLPPLALRALTADPELVLDGGRPLLVGPIAGIEHTAKRHVLGLLSVVRLLLRRRIVVGGFGLLEMLARDLAPKQPGEPVLSFAATRGTGARLRPFPSRCIAPAFPDSVTLEGRFEPAGKPCQMAGQRDFLPRINGLSPHG